MIPHTVTTNSKTIIYSHDAECVLFAEDITLSRGERPLSEDVLIKAKISFGSNKLKLNGPKTMATVRVHPYLADFLYWHEWPTAVKQTNVCN